MSQDASQLSRPPASVTSWITMFGLIATVSAGSFGYGVLTHRVEVLESFSPLEVDRRLGAIEQQLAEVLRRLSRGDVSAPQQWQHGRSTPADSREEE